MRKPAPGCPQRTIIGGSTVSRLATIRAYSDRRGGALKEMTDGHRSRSLGNRRDQDKNPAKSSTLALTSLPCCSKRSTIEQATMSAPGRNPRLADCLSHHAIQEQRPDPRGEQWSTNPKLVPMDPKRRFTGTVFLTSSARCLTAHVPSSQYHRRDGSVAAMMQRREPDDHRRSKSK